MLLFVYARLNINGWLIRSSTYRSMFLGFSTHEWQLHLDILGASSFFPLFPPTFYLFLRLLIVEYERKKHFFFLYCCDLHMFGNLSDLSKAELDYALK